MTQRYPSVLFSPRWWAWLWLVGLLAGAVSASAHVPAGSERTSSARRISTNALPTITSFTPTGGSSGTTVTITGTNLAGATAVRFNGTVATITSNSGTSIQTTVPTGASAGSITVTTPDGTATSASSFCVPPYVISSPPDMTACAGQDVTFTVVVGSSTGIQWQASSNNGTSYFNLAGETRTSLVYTATMARNGYVIRAIVLGCTAPATSVPARLTVVQTAPTLTGFNVSSGPVGSTLRLTGTNLTGATSVRFDGGSGVSTTALSNNTGTSLDVVVPAGATTGTVSVVAPCGTATSPGSFLVPVTITALSPARNAPAGGRATQVAQTFTEAPDAASTALVRVFGAGGLKAGAFSLSGTTLRFDPTTDFKANEPVAVTVPGTMRSTQNGYFTKCVYQYTAAASGGTGVFSGSTNAGMNQGPRSVVAADVDGDGDMDLATANYAGNTVTLRLNAGDGSFGSTVTVANITLPYALTAADVDADGDLDLLVSGLNDSQITLLRNTAGAFSTAGTIPFANGITVHALATGDIDADGDLDLVGALRNQDAVAVARNNGAGSFALDAGTVAVGSQPVGVVLADIDADGDLDLLTANVGTSSASVRLNDGSGTFSGTGAVTLPGAAAALALADVDADGDLDVLLALSSLNAVSVCLNNGSGTFASASSVSVGTSPQALATGDVDGDGDLDLMTADYSGGSGSTLSLRLNNGSGTFSGTGTVSVRPGPTSLVLADFDGDTDVDVASSCVGVTGTATTVAVRLNENVPPTITSFSPSSGPEGTPVVLTGDWFIGVTAVKFNGTAATYTVNSPTQLTATVPVGATSGPISVTTTAGTGTSSSSFTVLPIYNGTLNQCLTTVPVTSTGAGQWQYLLADNGQLVAAINDGGYALGTVSARFTQAALSAVRQDARGRYYLDRNWQLSAQNGFTGRAVTVRFYALNAEFTRLSVAATGTGSAVSSLAALRLTQYAGNNEDCAWDNNTAPTEVRLLTPSSAASVSGSNWFAVESTVADHFSEFYLNGGSTPLPVELTSLTAERSGNDALLRWTTAQELYNDHFEVEASTDGQTYLLVGQVAGQGSSTTARYYSFIDANLTRYGTSVVYYRLRQVDRDGTAAYSTVRSLSVHAATELTAYPNPGHRLVRVDGAGANAAVELYDATGRCLLRQPADAAGTTQLQLPTSLPTGVYLLRAGYRSLRLQVQ